MFEIYVSFVKNHLILSSFIQFALLGLLGEIFGIWVSQRKIYSPFNLSQIILKIIGWGILGIIIKYAFTGFVAFTEGLLNHKLLPNTFNSVLGTAFLTSTFMNLLFGPQMMFFHRFTDNLIMKIKGYSGIEAALKTLIWFWIPAHTITFILPVEFRIGLAALWSVVLGIIMGLVKPKEIN